MTTATTPPPTTSSSVHESGEVSLCPPVLDWKGDAPLRFELCSPSQFGELARVLAASAEVGPSGPAQALLRRLRENGRVLRTTYRDIAIAAGRQEPLTPAAKCRSIIF